jgi:hypothetical protein
MSAYVVDKDHIDALVKAGLELGRPEHVGSLRWFWPEITEQDREQASRPGEAISNGDVELARDRSHELRQEDAHRVGAMLWAENVRSVSFRYDTPEDGDLPGPITFGVMDVAEYQYKPHPGWIEPVAVLKALDCFEYQSCEHPGWRASEAHAYCESLRGRAIGSLPGYREASWGAPAKS